jgi:hypothetical protein
MKFVHTADTYLGFDFIKTPSPDEKVEGKGRSGCIRNFLAVVKHALTVQADSSSTAGSFQQVLHPQRQADLLIRPFLTFPSGYSEAAHSVTTKGQSSFDLSTE